jgi:hypothetical protein
MKRSDKGNGKKKSKLKIFGYSILAIIVVILAVVGYDYYQLQPTNILSRFLLSVLELQKMKLLITN